MFEAQENTALLETFNQSKKSSISTTYSAVDLKRKLRTHSFSDHYHHHNDAKRPLGEDSEPHTPVHPPKERNSISKLTMQTLIGYSVGHVLNDMSAACWFTYLLVFLKKVVHLSSLSAGIVFFFGQSFDALATPLAGIISDNSEGIQSKHFSLGPRKVGHLIGSLAVFITFLSVFGKSFVPNMSGSTATAYYTIAASLFNIGWASTQVSHMAMIPELSPICRDRLMLSSGRYAATILCNVAVFLGFLLLVQFMEPIGVMTAWKFTFLAICCVGVGMFCTVVLQLCVREKAGRKCYRALSSPLASSSLPMGSSFASPATQTFLSAPATHIQATSNNKKLMRVIDWFAIPAFYQVAFIYMTTRLFTNICQVYLPLYTLNYMHMGTASLGLVPIVLYISSLLYTFVLERLNTFIGTCRNFNLGCVFVLIASALFATAKPETSWMVYVAAVFLGAGSASCTVISLTMETELIGDNIEGGAFVFGALSFTDKLSSGIAVLVVQVLEARLENPHDLDPCANPSCASFVRDVMAYIPLLAASSAALVCVQMNVWKSLPTID